MLNVWLDWDLPLGRRFWLLRGASRKRFQTVLCLRIWVIDISFSFDFRISLGSCLGSSSLFSFLVCLTGFVNSLCDLAFAVNG